MHTGVIADNHDMKYALLIIISITETADKE